MEDLVIPDIMNDIFLPQERYPEYFVLISQLEVCQEGGVKKGGLGGRWGFLMRDLEDRVILDDMDDLGRPQGSYPEGFVSLSLFLAEIWSYFEKFSEWLRTEEEEEDGIAFPELGADSGLTWTQLKQNWETNYDWVKFTVSY